MSHDTAEEQQRSIVVKNNSNTRKSSSRGGQQQYEQSERQQQSEKEAAVEKKTKGCRTAHEHGCKGKSEQAVDAETSAVAEESTEQRAANGEQCSKREVECRASRT